MTRVDVARAISETHKTRMRERKHNLVVRVDDEELDMVHALSESTDEPAARIVRRFIRDAYGARFGATPPPKRTRAKEAKQ